MLMEKLLRVAGSHWCGSFGNFSHLIDPSFHAAQMKKRRAADETVCAGVRAIGDSFEVHSAVNANVVIQVFLVPPLVSLLDFGQRFVDECLAAEARIDSHNQQRIYLIQVRFNQRDGSGRVDGEADLLPQRANCPDQLRDTLTKLDVNIHLIGTGFRKRFQQNLWLGTHQVDVEEHFGQWTDGLHDGRAEGDVLDEVAVHDVKVQPVVSRSIGAPGFFFQASEIGGEQRRRNIHVRGQYRLNSKSQKSKVGLRLIL